MEGKKRVGNIIEEREASQRGFLYALVLCVAMIVTSILIYITVRDDIFEEIHHKQTNELVNMEEEIHSLIEHAIEHANNISIFPQTAKTFHGDREAIADSKIILSAIGSYNKEIDQLRLIDKSGKEIIRINNSDTGVTTVVPDSSLQDKSHRYYFTETMQAERDEVYVSPLDLNIENRQLEIPYNPVIRMGMPVFENGVKEGIVILNYKAKALYSYLDRQNVHEGDHWLLLNSDGYYLHNHHPESMFGFAIEERRNKGMFADYPQVWSQMQTKDEGIYIVDDGWFFYKKISPTPEEMKISIDRSWFLIMMVPASEIKEELQHLVLGLQIGNLILIPLFIIVGWLLGNYQIRNKYYKIELENQARIDPLTGLYNRRYVNELLVYNTSLASRQGGELSLAYIDLNNLKYVNDKYGHEMGDLMILSAAQAMLNNVRKTDIVARMGGDEFMMVLPDCSKDKLNIIMSRIIKEFESAGQVHMNRKWTLSWGSAAWSQQTDSIGDFIGRADSAMYEHKRKYKREEKEDM